MMKTSDGARHDGNDVDGGEDDGTGPSRAVKRGIPLMTTDDLEAAIGAGGFNGDSEETTSSEEQTRLGLLRRYRDDPEARHRAFVIADGGTVQRLCALALGAPNMARAIEVVRRAAVLSQATQRPLAIPPLLLVGPPGCGKTRVATLLAQSLGTSSLDFVGTAIADPHALLGSGINWKGAGIGGIAKALLAASTTTPLVVIDEAEKLSAYNGKPNPLDCILPLLEPTTASRFRDNYLDVPMRAEYICWVLCANTLNGLSQALIDRCVTIHVDALSGRGQRDVIEEIVDGIMVENDLPFADLGAEAVAALEVHGLRRARQITTMALAGALEDGRWWPTAEDIHAAAALLVECRPDPRPPAGFIHH